MRNHSEILPLVMKRLTVYLDLHPNLIDYNGKLLVVEAGRIRIRE
jgi:hypothetical protein